MKKPVWFILFLLIASSLWPAAAKPRVGLFASVEDTEINEQFTASFYNSILSSAYDSLEYSFASDFTNLALVPVHNKQQKNRLTLIDNNQVSIIKLIREQHLDYAIVLNLQPVDSNSCDLRLEAYDAAGTRVTSYRLGDDIREMSPDLLGKFYGAGLIISQAILKYRQNVTTTGGQLNNTAKSILIMTVTNNVFLTNGTNASPVNQKAIQLINAEVYDFVENTTPGFYSDDNWNIVLNPGPAVTSLHSGLPYVDDSLLVIYNDGGISNYLDVKPLTLSLFSGIYLNAESSGYASMSAGYMTSLDHSSQLHLGAFYNTFYDNDFSEQYVGLAAGYYRDFFADPRSNYEFGKPALFICRWFIDCGWGESIKNNGQVFFLKPGAEVNFANFFKIRGGAAINSSQNHYISFFFGLEFSIPFYYKTQEPDIRHLK